MQKSKFGVEVHNLIKQIRAENRTYGKAKICVVLRNVGRIMKKFGFSRSRSALRCKKKNVGSMNMPNHPSSRNTTKRIYYVIVTKKWRHNEAFLWNSGIYNKANSANAAEFLRELVENVPYKVCSIQVDGSSEFMKNFEHACKELGIPLFVLPPARRLARTNPIGIYF